MLLNQPYYSLTNCYRKFSHLLHCIDCILPRSRASHKLCTVQVVTVDFPEIKQNQLPLSRHNVDNAPMDTQKSIKIDYSKSDIQAEDIFEALHTFIHSYRACLFRILRDNPHGITPMDAKTLYYISRHPGYKQSDLIKQSGKDKGQIARLIMGLRERGLVKVQVDDKDRRSLQLYLTEVGQNLQAEMLEQRLGIHREIMKNLNATERQTMLEIIEKLQAEIDSNSSGLSAHFCK